MQGWRRRLVKAGLAMNHPIMLSGRALASLSSGTLFGEGGRVMVTQVNCGVARKLTKILTVATTGSYVLKALHPALTDLPSAYATPRHPPPHCVTSLDGFLLCVGLTSWEGKKELL